MQPHQPQCSPSSLLAALPAFDIGLGITPILWYDSSISTSYHMSCHFIEGDVLDTDLLILKKCTFKFWLNGRIRLRVASYSYPPIFINALCILKYTPHFLYWWWLISLHERNKGSITNLLDWMPHVLTQERFRTHKPTGPTFCCPKRHGWGQ